MASSSEFETLLVKSAGNYVTHVSLNRPDRGNALNKTMWAEIRAVFEQLSEDQNTRAIVVSGSGKMFTGGLDLQVRFASNSNELWRSLLVGPELI
jgi:delta(3,5)-delta(2,4)-dienoyl-CoA isomerase